MEQLTVYPELGLSNLNECAQILISGLKLQLLTDLPASKRTRIRLQKEMLSKDVKAITGREPNKFNVLMPPIIFNRALERAGIKESKAEPLVMSVTKTILVLDETIEAIQEQGGCPDPETVTKQVLADKRLGLETSHAKQLQHLFTNIATAMHNEHLLTRAIVTGEQISPDDYLASAHGSLGQTALISALAILTGETVDSKTCALADYTGRIVADLITCGKDLTAANPQNYVILKALAEKMNGQLDIYDLNAAYSSAIELYTTNLVSLETNASATRAASFGFHSIRMLSGLILPQPARDPEQVYLSRAYKVLTLGKYRITEPVLARFNKRLEQFKK